MPVDTVTAKSIKVPWYQLSCLLSKMRECNVNNLLGLKL